MLDPQDLPMPVRSMPDMFTSWRKKVESADVQPRSVVDAPEVGAMPLPSAWDAGLKELPSETDLFNDLVATYKSKANVDGEPPRNKNHSIGIDLVMPEIALEKGVMRFEGGETAGLDRIEDYIFRQDCLKNYYDTRNGLMGANYSSKFSPWLAMGCISARQIHVACQKYERMRVKNKSTYWMIFELLWRDFFHLYFMKHGSKPFMLKGVFPRCVVYQC
ncbi:hypothetical protein SARC_10938 [Sphaeroforma arctica JP610]|uniref:Cryptochrome/DNA photolyase FAD-binding domain-containing protein n=1 Tax=Sphaeroforma arctica JP610 TaxID=667725 RepID=A0A0L0FKP1_9EUKA|nr:hypothetical protein SARC_10938 [Sphaeroforma arctica JP610]KNC76568.1 hypothetical protein SARC_10938 [Sphaeroforma arctica JP610]|eukprot:XP_014150470.1 hypothetical protein SARC_10938 [Sphaeroforma arctica JP610]